MHLKLVANSSCRLFIVCSWIASGVFGQEMDRSIFEGMLQHLPDPALLIDAQLALHFSNDRARTTLGIKNRSAPRNANEWIPSESVSMVQGWLQRASESSWAFEVFENSTCRVTSVRATCSRIELDGNEYWILLLRPIDPGDTIDPIHYRRLSEAVESRRIGLWEHDHTTNDFYGSRILKQQYQLDPNADMPMGTLLACSHPDDLPYIVPLIQRAHDPNGDGLFNLTSRMILPSGETRWVNGQSRTFFATDADNRRFPVRTVGSLIDVTDELVVELNNERLVAIVGATPDIIATADLDGVLTYLNQAGHLLFDFSTICEHTVMELIHPSQRPMFHDLILPALAKQPVWQGELDLTDKDDQAIPCSVTVLSHERTRSNQAYLSLIARDLREKKHLEQQIIHSQKFEAVGRLAGGVAHDFNNLLSIIIGFSSISLQDKRLPPQIKSNLNEILDAGERGASLTRQLLTFSRKEVRRPRPVSVNQIIKGMLNMLRRLVSETIEISFLPEHFEHKIVADPHQLEQVLMNLVVNARDAMDGVGKITIETERVVLDEHSYEEHTDGTRIRPGIGPHISIIVSDTGSGMTKSTRQRIFEPFFTTKDVGKGTGLGLSTTLGIIEESGGTIWVYSEPGLGSTFKLYFPATTAQSELDAPSQEADRIVGGGTILLVEDEAQLRRMIATVLTDAGYKVMVASGPIEALSIAREHALALSLLLTDMVMPQMSGKQLVEILRAEGFQPPVLYMSGYTEDSMFREDLAPGSYFIPKPLSPPRLLEAVGTAIEPQRRAGPA